MAQGASIHIGLNDIDTSSPAYQGVTAPSLAGCWNDANAMEAIAKAQGFGVTTKLLDKDATADRVVGEITNTASSLGSGDILMVTYSGHGAQMSDQNGDESDQLDETWVLWDRMLVDDELAAAWDEFAEGVRILVVSDSCHSGTVSRDIYMQAPKIRGLAEIYAPQLRTVSVAVKTRAPGPPIVHTQAADGLRIRALSQSAAIVAAANMRRLGMVAVRSRMRETSAGATVLLLSGCQDNQLSADGTVNGLFTEKLLEVWGNGAFTSGYKEFHSQILSKMPATQSPNYSVTGAPNVNFEAERPFTVNPVSEQPTEDASGQGTEDTSGQSTDDSSNGSGEFDRTAGAPSVVGPPTVARTAPPPTFTVALGTNPYYAFEITSDPALFAASKDSARGEQNWYASWADQQAPERYTGGRYALPESHWNNLRSAQRLYYRICTSQTASGWEGYQTSTLDDDGVHAPVLVVA